MRIALTIALLVPACAKEALLGLCDHKPSFDNDADGYYSLGSCLAPADDCDDTNAAVHPGADELCDGIDNNCSGAVDEGFAAGEACGEGLGECRRQGVRVCAADGRSAACDAVPGTPGPELCDAHDNDCDGIIDEDFGGGDGCAAGRGSCQVRGFMVCSQDGQSLECNAVPLEPSPERCDGIDNDCDEIVDEGFAVGMDCVAGIGDCEANGGVVCSADGSTTTCTAQPRAPSTEICDGRDNNCDGRVDEGFSVGTACTVGRGACARTGATACSPANATPACDAVPGDPQPEICNFVDDNCDGNVDESCTLRDEDVYLLAGLEAEEYVDTQSYYVCTSPPGSSVTGGTLLVSRDRLPELASLLASRPDRFGVQIADGTSFTSPSCSSFASRPEPECGGWCSFSGMQGGGGLWWVGDDPGFVPGGVATFSLHVQNTYACNSSARIPNTCFGNPTVDAFWLCWHAELNRFCPASTVWERGDFAEDLAMVSCTRSVLTGRPSPMSIAFVGSTGMADEVDFGDGTRVQPRQAIGRDGQGSLGNDNGPTRTWSLGPRTQLFWPINPTFSGPMYVLIHTYTQPSTRYTVVANYASEWTNIYTGPMTWVTLTTPASDDPALCPTVFYPQ